MTTVIIKTTHLTCHKQKLHRYSTELYANRDLRKKINNISRETDAVRWWQLFHLLARWSGPLDHGLRWPVEEEKFREEQFFEGKFTSLADKVDILTETMNSVHVWQLKEHYVLDTADSLQPNDPTNDEDDGHIQPNDAASQSHAATAVIYDNLCTHDTKVVICFKHRCLRMPTICRIILNFALNTDDFKWRLCMQYLNSGTASQFTLLSQVFRNIVTTIHSLCSKFTCFIQIKWVIKQKTGSEKSCLDRGLS